MRNPLENEETAFRFVLGTIVYFIPIVLASWIATWLGVLVFVVATAAAVKVSAAPLRRPEGPPGPAPRALVEDTRRILVLVAAAGDDTRLRDAVVRLAEGFAEDVLVVVPASGGGEGAPEERLRHALGLLGRAGVRARGEVYEGGPLEALVQALGAFTADEVVVCTDEPLDADRVRTRSGRPVTYLTKTGL